VFLVGLTGGIGSGKSTVAARLAELGAVVIDADRIAREVVEPGTSVLAALVASFGGGILADDGSLDRAALATFAFADPARRAELERITHPAIADRITARLDELRAALADDALVVLDHPLLIETGQVDSLDALVVVLAPEDARVGRVVEARGLDPEDVRARMRAQTDDAQRRRLATHVLDNDGDVDTLRRRVDALHATLREAAAHRS
jgi:dephospho-CoA kinase